jgi:hypothetical protein
MNMYNSSTQSDSSDTFDRSHASSEADLAADILPSCFLIGIIAGFAAFVVFKQAIIPAVVAAVIGALLGLFFACEAGHRE